MFWKTSGVLISQHGSKWFLQVYSFSQSQPTSIYYCTNQPVCLHCFFIIAITKGDEIKYFHHSEYAELLTPPRLRKQVAMQYELYLSFLHKQLGFFLSSPLYKYCVSSSEVWINFISEVRARLAPGSSLVINSEWLELKWNTAAQKRVIAGFIIHVRTCNVRFRILWRFVSLITR